MFIQGLVKAESKVAKKSGKKLSGLFLMQARADGNTGDSSSPAGSTTVPQPSTTPQPQQVVNFESLIAAARKEEKDKLYPRIKALEDVEKDLTGKLNDALLREGALRQEVDNLKKSAKTGDGDSEELVKVQRELEAAKQKLEELEKNPPADEAAIRAKVEAEFEIKAYAQTKLAENKDAILTMLHETVTGSTKEEIDAAITAALEKTASVRKDLGLEETPPVEEKPEDGKKSNVPPAVQPKGSGKKGGKLDLEKLRTMDVNSEEYKEFRKQMGLK